jgi:hypothetical protein
MRTVLASLLTLSLALVSTPRAQAGRYIPSPCLRIGLPSGVGGHFIPHLPFRGDNRVFRLIVTILGSIVLVFVGWRLGQAVGRWFRSPPKKPKAS